MTNAAFDRVLGVNLRGSFLCARQQIRQLLEDDRPGAILNISSSFRNDATVFLPSQ